MKSLLLSIGLILSGTCYLFCQESWSNGNLSFGFGRVGIMNNELEEKSNFHPFVNFELTYGRSLYRSVGIKTSLAHRANWYYTRAAFEKVDGQVVFSEQQDVRLNTYIRSNSINVGIGPQVQLYRRDNEAAFLSVMYVPSYHYINKVQFRVSDDTSTYGEDFKSAVTPLRHVVQLDVMVIKDRKNHNGFFNCLTFFGGIDLNGYSSGGKFRPTYLGLMIGI